MVSSALAGGQSLIIKVVSALALMVAAVSITPAYANSAAAASDSFRVKPEDLKSNQTALGTSDPEFRALNDSWGRIVGTTATKVQVAVPSINPVEVMKFSSGFGYRNAPTRGASRNHKGIDIPGPVGTPIYATADGAVGRAQWLGGYGKYVEINHGNAVQTRYGHLSAMNVVPGQSVRKGDILGYMGSTGRSTGSHLHYEVRIAGEAINPTAFLSPVTAGSNILIASKSADSKALGGPAEDE